MDIEYLLGGVLTVLKTGPTATVKAAREKFLAFLKTALPEKK